MAEAQSDVQVTKTPADDQRESDTPASRDKAAIPLDYSVGGDGVDVNMEAPISSEDLIRAGGLGAGDGVGTAMPTTVDSTDYEEVLMETAEYEDKEEAESCRHLHPGLGLKYECATGRIPPVAICKKKLVAATDMMECGEETDLDAYLQKFGIAPSRFLERIIMFGNDLMKGANRRKSWCQSTRNSLNPKRFRFLELFSGTDGVYTLKQVVCFVMLCFVMSGFLES